MTVIADVKLPQPLPAFGAEYGRNQHIQYRRYWIGAGVVALWLVAVTIFILASTTMPELNTFGSFMGFVVLYSIAVPVVALFGGAYAVLNYTDEIFAMDAYNGRRQYAATYFKEWFEERYNVVIPNAGAAEDLMEGGSARVRKRVGDKVELVNVRFDFDAPGFRRFAEVARRPDTDYFSTDDEVPDVSKVEFRLIVMEDPAQPRQYYW